MEQKNYYELLNVDANSTQEDIERAVRVMRKRYRQLVGSPDQQTRLNAELIMAQLAEAEETLLDAQLRMAYDYQLKTLAVKQEHEIQKPESNGVQQWLDAAEDYLASGSPESARLAAKRIIDIDSDNLQAWMISFRALVDLDLYEEAILANDQILRLDPNNNDMQATKLQLLYEIEAHDRAEKYCRYIIDRAPSLVGVDLPWWQMHLAHLLFLKGSFGDSFNYYKQLVYAYPRNSQIKVRYAEDLLLYVAANLSSNDQGVYIGNQNQYDLLESSLTEVENLTDWDVLNIEMYVVLKQLFDEGNKKEYSKLFWGASIFFGLGIIGGVIELFSDFSFGNFGKLIMVVIFSLVVTGIINLMTTKTRWKTLAKGIESQI